MLLLSLLQVLLRFLLLQWTHRGALTLAERAQWLHSACTLILRRIGMRVIPSGAQPSSGLVVSNHLSYLDILFYSAVMPCIFVAKYEVRSWPLFGLLARCGGTIFVIRDRSARLDDVTRRMREALAAGIPILLFPEGTSTDGSQVLRFHASLFEPAIQLRAPISTAAIAYSIEDGLEADLCYYGDIRFVPSLLTTLGRRRVTGHILFTAASEYEDRKAAARQTRERVVAARQSILEG